MKDSIRCFTYAPMGRAVLWWRNTKVKFADLDKKMRVFETNYDHSVLPGLFMVARLDGRNFTRLTKDTHNFKRPFDDVFRDHMTATAEHLMNCGFRILYGFTESDEISLLLHPEDGAFGRKTRKLNSVLAGEASACFSLRLGDLGCFDCRISELPSLPLVVDYFRWRNEDAHRNALNAYCYWEQRKQGASPTAAAGCFEKKSVADKNEFLFQCGINFNDIPKWQKRGIGLYWEEYEKPAFDPMSQWEGTSKRRRLKVDYDLPLKDEHGIWLNRLLQTELL
jgi:tRNA(His) 5'-end guanylyltransferase